MCDKNYIRVIFIIKFISCPALHKLGYSPSWLAANAEFLWEILMMDKKTKECIRMMRDLVSDVQGAPFPGEELKPELYSIWYEHAQRAAVECFEFLDANFPSEQNDVNKSIDKLFD